MKVLFAMIFVALLPVNVWAACAKALDFELRQLNGKETVKLCETYADQVVLVVNTASKCGFTPQYEGLEALYRDYQERGFVVLGFPSNDFGGQELGNEAAIQEFCRLTYGVQFPMFEKIHAKEGKAHPLISQLADLAGGDYPRWNFHKYLLNREGELVSSFDSNVTPDSLRDDIEGLL